MQIMTAEQIVTWIVSEERNTTIPYLSLKKVVGRGLIP